MAYLNNPQPLPPASLGVAFQPPPAPINATPTVAESNLIESYVQRLKALHVVEPMLVTIAELNDWTSYHYKVQEDISTIILMYF